MEFVVLADSAWDAPTPEEEAAGWRWSYRLDVAFAGRDSRVAVSQTAPKENHAAVLGLAEALAPSWAEHRTRAGADWLVPWLERLSTTRNWRARGLERGVVAEFERRHGRRPTSYDWDV